MKIEKGRRVRLKVLLEVKGGDVLEKSVVEYFQGGGTMLPGLERQLEGLEPGAKKKGTIKAENAFGDPSMHPVKKMPRSEFPEDAKLEPGETFAAKGVNGQDVLLAIVEADDDEVSARLVHPLHEKDIDYDVEILAVTDPAPPPLPPDAVELDEDAGD